jgi:hypothetical protein
MSEEVNAMYDEAERMIYSAVTARPVGGDTRDALRGELVAGLRSAAHVCQHNPCTTCLVISDEEFDAQIDATAVHGGEVARVQGSPEAIAEAILVLPAVRDALAAQEKLRRVEALADAEDAYVEETQFADLRVAIPMKAGREVLDRIFGALADAVYEMEPERTDWDPFVAASMPETPQVPVHLLRRALAGES